MIKPLITDIAYDNIKLSQALTRAKLIANKINSDVFSQWLKKELEGYEYNDPLLPDYRKIRSVLYLVYSFPMGGQDVRPVAIGENAGKLISDEGQFYKEIEPISVIEQTLETLAGPKLRTTLPPELVNLWDNLMEEQSYGSCTGGYKEFGKNQVQSVLELTKQKLLDTLLELDKQFPNLENEFAMNKDNAEKVQNIVTNHIYGNNNPVNVAAGQNVVQKDIQITFSQQDFQKLKDLGVSEEHVSELQTLVTTEKDKPTLMSNVLQWLSKVSASVAAHQLSENIPAITEFVTNLVK